MCHVRLVHMTDELRKCLLASPFILPNGASLFETGPFGFLGPFLRKYQAEFRRSAGTMFHPLPSQVAGRIVPSKLSSGLRWID